MPRLPRTLIVQTATDHDRLADRLLLRAYLLVVPLTARSFGCHQARSYAAPRTEQDREQAR